MSGGGRPREGTGRQGSGGPGSGEIDWGSQLGGGEGSAGRGRVGPNIHSVWVEGREGNRVGDPIRLGSPCRLPGRWAGRALPKGGSMAPRAIGAFEGGGETALRNRFEVSPFGARRVEAAVLCLSVVKGT